jgi:hypothetical protein
MYSWFAISALCTEPVVADSIWSQFFDPKDGNFDVSQMLAKDLGFLPVPILITEPAIGFGRGLAAVFYHDDPEEAKRREEAFQGGDEVVGAFLRPSTSVLFGAATENGSEIHRPARYSRDALSGRRRRDVGAAADLPLEPALVTGGLWGAWAGGGLAWGNRRWRRREDHRRRFPLPDR